MLITRTKSERQPEPVPPPAWEQQLESLRTLVLSTLSDIEARVQKCETRMLEDINRIGRDAVAMSVKQLPQSLTDPVAAIEKLRQATQLLADDFDAFVSKNEPRNRR
jgi:hypothetical protein